MHLTERTVSVILFVIFVIVFSFNKESMNTYHAALWSDDSSSSDDEYLDNYVGERFADANIVNRVPHGGGGVMV